MGCGAGEPGPGGSSESIVAGKSADAPESVAAPAPAPVQRAVSVEFEERPLESGVARIEFKEHTIDVGRVTDTGVYQARFHFVNRGAETLTIRQVKAGCKCAEAATSRLSYGPGEQGSIVVTLKPTGKKGYRPSVVQVLSNSTPNEMETISMMATVEPMLSFDSTLQSIGRLDPGVEHRVPFEMVTGIDDLVFTRQKTNHDHIGLRVVGTGRDNGDGTRTFAGEMVIPADAPWSVFRGLRAASANIHVRGTPIGANQLASGSYSFRIEGSIYKEVVPTILSGHGKGAEGALFYLGTIRTGAAFQHEILLEAHDAPFRILGTKLESATGLQAQVTVRASGEKGHVIVFSGKAPATKGPLRGDIVVTTDTKHEQLVRIAFQGSVIGGR